MTKVRVCAERVLAAACLAFAAWWLWTSLVAIASFAFRYPAFDQYRLFPLYFNEPFPRNVLLPENGHRPVFPTLLRLAEMRWLDADQSLQIATGIACALLALGLIVWTLARQRDVARLRRAAGVLLAVIALFWLGNARMLMHGNELVHVYPIIALAAAIGLAVHAARGGRALLWMSVAAVCAFVATFTFGTGMACFPALLAAAIVARVPGRALLAPLAMLVVAAIAYLLVLPQQGRIGGALVFDPAHNAALLLRWLSSPWMNAWLGVAAPGQHVPSDDALGRAVGASSRFVARAFGEDRAMQQSLVLGSIGFLAWLAMLAHAWRSGAATSRVRLLALSLTTFAIGAAAIICLARVAAFEVVPSQVFADRYLPWSCVFWLGIALYAGCPDGTGRERPLRAFAFAGVAIVCALLALPSDHSFAAWSAAVHRSVQRSAVAAQLGIWDRNVFPDNEDARRPSVIETIGLLRRHRLSMFAEPSYGLVESGWKAPAVLPAPLEDSSARIDRTFEDSLGNRRVSAFEGTLGRTRGLPRDPVLAVVDASGALRGLAKMSFVASIARLPIKRIRPRGFDGYVIDPRPGETLSIIVLDAAGSRALATIPLHVAASDPD